MESFDFSLFECQNERNGRAREIYFRMALDIDFSD